MDAGTVFGVGLVTFFSLTLAWPLNVPFMALAYKVRVGNKEVPLELWSFWLTSMFAAFALFGFSLLPVLVGLWITGLELLVFLVYFFFYFPLASIVIYRIYGLDDPVEGFSTLVLYLLLPGIPLFAILWATGLGPVIVSLYTHRLAA